MHSVLMHVNDEFLIFLNLYLKSDDKVYSKKFPAFHSRENTFLYIGSIVNDQNSELALFLLLFIMILSSWTFVTLNVFHWN